MIKDPVMKIIEMYVAIIPTDCEVLMFTFGTARKLTSTANITVDW